MPLIKSASNTARSSNIAAEIRSGRPRDQAAAIAYRIQRDAKRKKMAKGGRVKGYAPGGKVNVGPTAPPFYVRNAARSTAQPSGIISSTVAGRSDQIPMGVKRGAYVVPADVVSSLGQGNTMAGARGLSQMLKMTPGGSPMPSAPPMGRRPGKFADGGDVMPPQGGGGEPPVDIMAAGGEFIVPVDKVAEIGGGDMKRGHDILDAMVKQTRKKAIKTLRKLPGPRKR